MDYTHTQADARGNRRQARVLKKQGRERSQGIQKSQPVRKGVRRQLLRHCRQPISENNSTLGKELLPSPPKDIIPAAEKALQVSSSLPSPPVRQRKRKREEAFPEELSGSSKKSLQYSELNDLGRAPKVLKPTIHHSSRSSPRLRERRDRELRATSHPSIQIPSPSPSLDRDQERRKQDSKELKTVSLSPPRPPNPANELEATFTPTNRYNPIETWIESGNWPTDFAKKGFDMADSMSSAKNSAKRPRTSSYSQSVKNEGFPPPYTQEYEAWIVKKGLDMDLLKGEKYVSKESQKLCSELQIITLTTIQPSLLPESQEEALLKVLNRCQTRNESLVNRDVTMLLVPPITYHYLHGADHLEHVIDEVNADWDERCVLAGPRPRPDLAIGLFSSAFTPEEIDKMDNYTAFENWTRFTGEMYFPFFMCDVKRGKDGLNMADRQNMHSGSVALKGLLRIEQEADKYRAEKKLASLDGQILVFSVSHDQKNARIYGHFARIHEDTWTYHRSFINAYVLFPKRNEILALHNFIQNIFKTHLPIHLQRLKDALAAFPEPGVLSSVGTGVTDDISQQNRDADGFLVPGRPASAARSEDTITKQQMEYIVQRMDKQQREQLERMDKQQREQLEQQRQESKEREERMQKQLDEMMKLIASTKTTN